MKYLKQIAIILAVSFLGEFLNWLLPFPIPGSIYGMVILFVALMTGVIRLSSVKNVGDFLIDILPLLFIPPTVGLLDVWPVMQGFLVAIIVISIVSTIIVAAVSGRVTQYFLRHKENLKDEGTAL
jgi:holin-like protein